MEWDRVNEEVLISREPLTGVGQKTIQALIALAMKNRRKRIRLCAHRHPQDKVHEMLIVHAKGNYIRPHYHLGKSESYHMIQGQMDLVVFEENGPIREILSLGEIDSGRTFFCRLEPGLYHTLLVRSEIVVFQETTSGPFDRRHTSFAAWAPEDTTPEAVENYLDRLQQELAKLNLLPYPLGAVYKIS